MEEINWLHNLKENVFRFMEQMESKKREGFYKYSFSGDFYSDDLKWNVGSSVFALKIYYIIGLIDSTKINNISNYIKSFQKQDNSIYDSLIFKKTYPRNFLSSIKHKNFDNLFNSQYKRAESRQSYSSLMMFDKLPTMTKGYNIPVTEEKINKYLSNLNWNQPWGAGSHFSHLLFFLNLNHKTNNLRKEDYDSAIQFAVNWISKLQNNNDGTWYKGITSNRFKINGAMKIITGLNIIDKVNFKFPEKIIDLCLNSINDNTACDNFNIIYVLNYCSKILFRNYRQDEIEEFALNRLRIYKEHFHEELGGFSFFQNKANTHYYKFNISKGKNEPDIHGTVLFLWGISIICQILKIDSSVNFKEFKT